MQLNTSGLKYYQNSILILNLVIVKLTITKLFCSYLFV